MLQLYEDGTGRILELGMGAAPAPQGVAPAYCWHGSRPKPGGPHGYSLVSTIMAPAYRDSDVTFAGAASLTETWPEWADHIQALTRD